MVLAHSMLDHSVGVLWGRASVAPRREPSVAQRREASVRRGRGPWSCRPLYLPMLIDLIWRALGERCGWLWDTIEEGLGTYLYGFSEDVMRMDSRLYRIRTKEYPITTRLCTNIQRKSVEE